jgi:general secretion pathway protein K
VQGWGDKTTIWAGSAAPPEADGQTAITSNWFDLRIDVTLPGTEVQEHALIDATRLPVRLVSRQWGDEL